VYTGVVLFQSNQLDQERMRIRFKQPANNIANPVLEIWDPASYPCVTY
jgi:hypothetical protein